MSNELRFLVNEAAGLLGRRLVVADLHLGFDRDYKLRFSYQILDHLIELAMKEQAKEVIVLGDFKDEIMTTPRYIKGFITRLEEYVDLILIKGNHDATLDRYHEVYDFYIWEKYGMMHGHTKVPPEFEGLTVLMGHVHPSWNGTERVWLRGDSRIIFPAFNPALQYPIHKGLERIGETFKIEDIILLSGVRIR